MDTLHHRYRHRRHFESLDGVRCLAIFGVLWHHGGMSDGGLGDRGFLGVDLFFVLSGFLIVTLLLRERATHGSISLKKFYIRRTLRIFPPYYALLTGLAVLYLFAPGLNTASGFWTCLPFYLTYTSNWSIAQAANLGIMWSLATEEQFYLVWPAVEKYLRSRWLGVALIGVIVLNQLINFGLFDNFFAWLYGMDSVPPLWILDTTFTPIAFGVVIAHLLHREETFGWLAAFLSNRYSPVLLLLSLLIALVYLPADLSGWPRLLIHFLMAIWLASLVIREDHYLHVCLAAKPIAFVGTISYGIYLYHMFVFYFIDKLGNRFGLHSLEVLFVLKVAATIAFAFLSYRWLEKPCLRLKQRFV